MSWLASFAAAAGRKLLAYGLGELVEGKTKGANKALREFELELRAKRDARMEAERAKEIIAELRGDAAAAAIMQRVNERPKE